MNDRSWFFLGMCIGTIGIALFAILSAKYNEYKTNRDKMVSLLSDLIKRLSVQEGNETAVRDSVIAIAKAVASMKETIDKVESLVLASEKTAEHSIYEDYDKIYRDYRKQGYSDVEAKEIADSIFSKELDSKFGIQS